MSSSTTLPGLGESVFAVFLGLSLLAFLTPPTIPYVAGALAILLAAVLLDGVVALLRSDESLRAADLMALDADDVDERWD